MSPAEKALLGGAVDLSELSKPKEDLPEGATRCIVEDGCNLAVLGGPHESMKDCLDTIFPYVERFMQLQVGAQDIVDENAQLRKVNNSVLKSNVMLVDKLEEQAAELRSVRTTLRQMQEAADVPE